jgi:Ras-related protein Rab-18
LRFTTEEFKDDQKSTIGVDLKLKLMQVNGKNLKLTIWDTAGKLLFIPESLFIILFSKVKNDFEH